MTVRNILAGCHHIGIYPLDCRHVVVPVKAEESTKHKVKVHLLYSPAKPRCRSSGVIVFSEEDQIKFQKRYEEGYDI